MCIRDSPWGVLKEDANRRPHVRFTAQTLGELPEPWPQAQNDALGHALWLRCVLANTGAMPLTGADAAIFALFPAYFAAIKYWQDQDSGAWEESRKINNSSVGAVVAGLQEMNSCPDFGASRAQLPELIAKAVNACRKRCRLRLRPNEWSMPRCFF